ncbi:tRNA pseudouridine(55) synthase TruB [Buchnera aphidicola]|uniref:tRNA pseudouridine(55) synthase TruB n=1 Tax=Buchnera aphidicola TaxID=9 RepID=UPI0034643849
MLLDKPQGISSNQALQKIKKIFRAHKAGYIGTLDPLATGILPICFGEATKLSNYLTNSIKSYHVIGKLGQVTSTYDSEGSIVETHSINFTQIEFYNALQNFQGKIIQFPPVYSAIKYQGLPLYKYARKNISVPKIQRTVFIYHINCIQFNNEIVELEITCSKGTYIRTLIHDLGKLLKCGAHVIFLRRLMVGIYHVSKAINFMNLYKLRQFSDALDNNNIMFNLLLSLKDIFFTLPEIKIDSLSTLYQKQKFCPIPLTRNSFVRITIKENKKIFIIGMVGNLGELISYKLLNI